MHRQLFLVLSANLRNIFHLIYKTCAFCDSIRNILLRNRALSWHQRYRKPCRPAATEAISGWITFSLFGSFLCVLQQGIPTKKKIIYVLNIQRGNKLREKKKIRKFRLMIIAPSPLSGAKLIQPQMNITAILQES